MAKVLRWVEATRDALELEEALVVIPIGATEQHGTHLSTGTDSILAEHIAERAAHRAMNTSPRNIVIAPCVPYGVSAHHQPFGGTLSLTAKTLLSVLTDLLDSLEDQGARRVLIINGHGGNAGVALAASGGADARTRLTVATLNYWEVDGIRALGHAGVAETSLMMEVAPDHVDLEKVRSVERAQAQAPRLPGLAYHAAWLWKSIDGVTDDPSQASREEGAKLLEHAVDWIAGAMVGLAELRSE